MDENLHSIDDLFKKAIEDHDEVPSSKVWENIDKNLDKKNVISITRKYEKWKWVAAALFIFSVGMATYAWNLYKEVVKANKVKTTNTYNQNRKRTNDKNNALDNSLTADEQKQKLSNKIKKSTTAADSTSSNNPNSVVKIERKNKQANNSNTSAETPKKDIHTVVKQMPEQLRAKNERQQIKESLVAGNKNDITGKEIKSNFKYDNPNKDVSVEMDSLYNASPSAEKFKVETATVSVPQNLFQVLPPVISSKGLSPVSIKPSAPNIVTKVRSSTKAVKPAKNTVSIFFSTGLVSTHLQNDLQHFREDDRHVIKQNEKRNYAYTIGLLVERNITGNLSILSGLSLAACVTEMNAINLFARPDNRGNVNYRLNSSKGYAYISSKSPASSSINSRPSFGDTIRSLSTTATLQYLSVPAGVRYHLNKGKFSFNPAIAFSANFVTKKKIETVLFVFGRDEKTTTRDIQGVKPAYFDGSFRTDLTYAVNRTIGISLIPSARFALSSITKNGPVKTYVNTFGLGLGLNVHF
jgi:hypothetical protein